MKKILFVLSILIASITSCDSQCVDSILIEKDIVIPYRYYVHIDRPATSKIIKSIESVRGVGRAWVKSDRYEIYVTIGKVFNEETVIDLIKGKLVCRKKINNCPLY